MWQVIDSYNSYYLNNQIHSELPNLENIVIKCDLKLTPLTEEEYIGLFVLQKVQNAVLSGKDKGNPSKPLTSEDILFYHLLKTITEFAPEYLSTSCELLTIDTLLQVIPKIDSAKNSFDILKKAVNLGSLNSRLLHLKLNKINPISISAEILLNLITNEVLHAKAISKRYGKFMLRFLNSDFTVYSLLLMLAFRFNLLYTDLNDNITDIMIQDFVEPAFELLLTYLLQFKNPNNTYFDFLRSKLPTTECEQNLELEKLKYEITVLENKLNKKNMDLSNDEFTMFKRISTAHRTIDILNDAIVLSDKKILIVTDSLPPGVLINHFTICRANEVQSFDLTKIKLIVVLSDAQIYTEGVAVLNINSINPAIIFDDIIRFLIKGELYGY